MTIEGLENAVIKEGESKGFTVKVTPNDDANLGEAFIDFGNKNSEIEYKDENGEYKPMLEKRPRKSVWVTVRLSASSALLPRRPASRP